jgi:TetR/AcrR family transcriptional repressor of nem operon
MIRAAFPAAERGYSTGMGRRRTYNETHALDAASAVFWEKGYASTSMADLCQAMSLEKGSVYHAFGGKRDLFSRVLERYLAEGLVHLDAALAGPEPVPDAIAGFLRGSLVRCDVDGAHLGCMAVNTMVELGPGDPGFAQRIRDHFGVVHGRLQAAIERGQAKGEVRTDRTAGELVALVVTVLGGLVASDRVQSAAASSIELVRETLRPSR